MLREIAENLFVQDHRLGFLGAQFGRRVTVVRMEAGDLLIHSTGPFTPEDVGEIGQLGTPRWLVEATRFHDTFAKRGRAAFPDLPFLAPPRLASKTGGLALDPGRHPWGAEVGMLALRGIPKADEHVFLHGPSRTLIVADLVFNFPDPRGMTRFMLRHLARIREMPGTSRMLKMLARDRAAFRDSVDQLLDWDFDRVVVGHGEIIERDGRAKLLRALRLCGLVR